MIHILFVCFFFLLCNVDDDGGKIAVNTHDIGGPWHTRKRWCFILLGSLLGPLLLRMYQRASGSGGITGHERDHGYVRYGALVTDNNDELNHLVPVNGERKARIAISRFLLGRLLNTAFLLITGPHYIHFFLNCRFYCMYIYIYTP